MRIALLVVSSVGGFWSAVSLYLTLGAVMIVGFVFAPQKVVRDRRAIVAALLIVLAIIGAGVSALAVYDVCSDPSIPNWLYYVAGCYLPPWARI